ncbi:MAG TPA: hypothetical protein DGD08_12245 [Gemmatimonas aurantiaca]|nr:hypothetical protein [Gemmatimonas aurantiaca]
MTTQTPAERGVEHRTVPDGTVGRPHGRGTRSTAGRASLAVQSQDVQIPQMSNEASPDLPNSPATSTQHTPCHLILLGDARISRGPELWTGRAAQNRRLAVLVLLAGHVNRRCSRQAIQTLLWPDADGHTARRLLNESVYIIRKELGTTTLESHGEYLALGRDVTSDLEWFRAAASTGELERAVAIYSGPFLGTWSPADMPEFEQWVTLEREVAARQHRDCLQRLATIAEAVEDWPRAIEWHQRLLSADPFGVQAAIALARAQARAGEPLRAMQTIDALANTWRLEFGEPIPDALTSLRRELLSAAGLSSSSPQSPPTTREAVTTESGGRSPEAPVPLSLTPSNLPHATSNSNADGERRRILQRFPLAFGLAVLLAIILSAGVAAIRRPPVHSATTFSHLAILPFETPSGDYDGAFVATGLAEALSGTLGGFTGLRLIAPEVFTRRRTETYLIDSIARRFGGPLVLRAVLETSRNEISVTARLIDSQTGEQITSVLVTAPREDLSTLRQELVTRVAVAVRQRLGLTNNRELFATWTKLGTATPEGVALVWRAQHRIRDLVNYRLSTQRDSLARKRMQTSAAETDSLLAATEQIDARWFEPTLLRARLAWERARLEVGPARLAEIAIGLGHVERAITLLGTTAAEVPSSATGAEHLEIRLRNAQQARAYFLRGTLRLMTVAAMATGRSEHAIASAGESDLQIAVRLDSLLAPAWAALARPHWMRADFQGAQRAAEMAIRADPFGEALEESINWAARSAAARGERNTTLRWCRRGRAEVPSTWLFLDCELLVHALDAAGLGDRPNPAAAWALVDTLERLDAGAIQGGRNYSPVYRRLTAAAVSAAAGDTERARRELQHAQQRVATHSDMQVDIKYDAAFVYTMLGETATARAELASYVAARPDYAQAVIRHARFRALKIPGSSP